MKIARCNKGPMSDASWVRRWPEQLGCWKGRYIGVIDDVQMPAMMMMMFRRS